MPRLEVSGTNNYDQRNYNAKGTAAASAADKSSQASRDNDRWRARSRETARRRSGGACSAIPQLSSEVSAAPKPI